MCCSHRILGWLFRVGFAEHEKFIPNLGAVFAVKEYTNGFPTPLPRKRISKMKGWMQVASALNIAIRH